MTTYTLTGVSLDTGDADVDLDLTSVGTTSLSIVVPDIIGSLSYNLIPDGFGDVYPEITSGYYGFSLGGDILDLSPASEDGLGVVEIQWGSGNVTYVLAASMPNDAGGYFEGLFYLGGDILPALTTIAEVMAFSNTMTGFSYDVTSGPFAAGVDISFLSLPGVTVTEHDTIVGSDLADILNGGIGDDTIGGGAGDDTLLGGAGIDTLSGGTGGDTMRGGGGNDVMRGGGGSDTMYGGAGRDTMFGGSGLDVMRGGAHRDFMYGSGGNDRLFGQGGHDVMNGGAGRDTMFGGAGNDVMRGGVHRDFLYGGGGNDRLFGQGGYDVMNGGAGSDIMFGGFGNDRMNGGGGNDTMTGGAGNDIFVFTASSGDDVVTDFSRADDIVRLNGTGLDFAGLSISYAGGDATVDYGTGSFVLEGISSGLDASDFIFIG